MILSSARLRPLIIGQIAACVILVGCGTEAIAQGSPIAPPTADPAAAPPSPAKPRPKSTALIDAGEPRAASHTVSKPADSKARGAADRLDLNTATVTGDREQPKVMYIVPWKKSDIGDLSGKPMNSLLDEALSPIDRDEFKREVAYYGALGGDAPQSGVSKAAKQGER